MRGPVKVEKLIKTLRRLGFEPIRQRGSHIFFKHSDGRVTVVPFHKGEEIGRGLLRKIALQINMEPEELYKTIIEDE
jgi:predicted RNA binding protein YcfA (HicA-like mRNA interferase family)